MEKTQDKNLQINEPDNLSDSLAKSPAFQNPVWDMLEEMCESRPYKIDDFKKDYFVPDK